MKASVHLAEAESLLDGGLYTEGEVPPQLRPIALLLAAIARALIAQARLQEE